LRQYEETVSFDVTIPGKAQTLDTALTNSDGDFIHAKGVVTSFNDQDQGFFIQNSENSLGLFISSDDFNNEIEKGDLISIHGQLGRNTSYKSNQRMLGGDILVTSIESTEEAFVKEDSSLTDIINDYNTYDIAEPLNQSGGTTDSIRYTLEDVTLSSIDAFNYVFIDSIETDMSLIFDIDEAEGLTLDEYSDGMNISSITFTTEKIHFGNYRVVNVVINQ